MNAGTVTAALKFLADLDGPLVYIPSKGGGDDTQHVGNFAQRDVPILNARDKSPAPTIDVEGFCLVRQDTKVRDFYDDTEIATTWHAEVEALLRKLTGARRVVIFDDTRRSGSRERQRDMQIREPAEIVHNDYTATSGVRRLRDHFADLPDEADKLLERRFAIINVWRSIAGPIYNQPIALCDASSVDAKELVSVERRADERIGEIQVALFGARQRWYYFPDMQMDEALLIKTFDSQQDGRARFTVHTSFELEDVTGDKPARESIETRCFVFF